MNNNFFIFIKIKMDATHVAYIVGGSLAAAIYPGNIIL